MQEVQEVARPDLVRGREEQLRLTGDVAVLVFLISTICVPAQTISAPPGPVQPAALTALNNAFRAAYADAKIRELSSAGPILIVSGDNFSLLRGGNRLEANVGVPIYDVVKTFAHIPLAIYVTLAPGGGALDEGRLKTLAELRKLIPPARESLAWCHWQLGETAFTTGDYAAAEQQYRAALTVFPDYYRALGGLGRTLAAHGDVNGAIAQYERATKILPDLTFVAALGDLYQLAGRAKDADAQFALCEQLGRLSAAGSEPYNRVLALFYADHDLNPAEAYRLAQREYAARHDIYGADALAWTAFKAGQANEAQRAMKESLRLGTQDAKLFYHAGLIARAAGDQTASHDYLQRALKLNPQFDPRQAPLARQALDANAK